MNTNRRIAVVAGVLFIIATLAQLVGDLVFLTPILNSPDYLTKISAHEDQVLLGALFMFIAAVTCPGIALALYPVLRKHNEGLALGSVGFRLIEGALYVLAVVGVLVLVTLSQGSANAGAPGSAVFQAQAALVMTARDWLGTPAAVLTFGLGALMYYWVFYRSRLVPRWLSVWGLVAVAMVMLAGVLVMLRLAVPMSTTQVVLALPIFLQEMVMAVWLIAKGFNPSAIAAESVGRTSMPRAAASGSAA
jgi:magnesium-transporting ATPase (P-type)